MQRSLSLLIVYQLLLTQKDINKSQTLESTGHNKEICEKNRTAFFEHYGRFLNNFFKLAKSFKI